MIRLVQFVNFFIASGSEHGENESINEIVTSHLGDHLITSGFIGKINELYLSQKLFGVFDMRITKLVLMMWLSAFLCLVIFIPVSRALKKEKSVSNSKWINLWEVLVSFVHDDIVEPNFHHHHIKKAMPYFCTIFFFILFCNLMGMIPSLQTPTGNLAVTAGLASLTLLGMIGLGIVKQGPIGYFTGLVPKGVPAFVIPMLFPIEIIGLLIKPFALTVRLFANMTGGHVVVLIFLYLVMMFKSYWVGIGSVAGALMIDLLELLVAFIQAYIFTSLSAMFISESMHSH